MQLLLKIALIILHNNVSFSSSYSVTFFTPNNDMKSAQNIIKQTLQVAVIIQNLEIKKKL